MTALLIASLLITRQSVVGGGFVRTINRSDGVSVSQTEAKLLRAPGLPDVWLIGAAHIGTKDYYTQLQGLLNSQDVVLFEGVRSAKNPKGQMPSAINLNAPKTLYQVIGDAIGLDFQLSDIDYNHPNWVNSDMSLSELDALNKKGAKGKPTDFDMIEQMIQPNSQQAKMLASFFQTASPSIKEALKIFLVDRLAKVETLLPGLTDQTTLNVILTARNKAVEAVLDMTIHRSPAPKSIGIFYGAAHQTEIQKVLSAKYGYQTVEQKWFTFAQADHRKLDAEGKQFIGMLDQMAKGAGK